MNEIFYKKEPYIPPQTTDRSYIKLAVDVDRDGALKKILESLGNINPTRHFI